MTSTTSTTPNAATVAAQTSSASQSAETTQPVVEQNFTVQFFVQYGPSLLYAVLSSVLVSLSVYMQNVFVSVAGDVQIYIKNLQLRYLNQATTLYNLSLQYSSGIIGVDSNSYLMNMDLVKKITFSGTDPVTLANSTTTIPLKTVQSVIDKYQKMFQGQLGSRIALLTNVNNVISVKVPDLEQPIMIPSLGGNSTVGDWFVTYQGLALDNCLYIINGKLKKTYIMRIQNGLVCWFQYKDENQDIYVTMATNGISIGDKEFMITKTGNGTVSITVRPKTEDILGLGV